MPPKNANASMPVAIAARSRRNSRGEQQEAGRAPRRWAEVVAAGFAEQPRAQSRAEPQQGQRTYRRLRVRRCRRACQRQQRQRVHQQVRTDPCSSGAVRMPRNPATEPGITAHEVQSMACCAALHTQQQHAGERGVERAEQAPAVGAALLACPAGSAGGRCMGCWVWAPWGERKPAQRAPAGGRSRLNTTVAAMIPATTPSDASTGIFEQVDQQHLRADEGQHQRQPVGQQVEAVGHAQQEEHRAQAEHREHVRGQHDERVGGDREDRRDRIHREDHVGHGHQRHHHEQRRVPARAVADDAEGVAVVAVGELQVPAHPAQRRVGFEGRVPCPPPAPS